NELYSFIWEDFCNWYVELSKASLNSDDIKLQKSAQGTLYICLLNILKLLHPFVPFVTEEIYQTFCHDQESLCLESWPEVINEVPQIDTLSMDRLISVIKKIREVKIVSHLKPSAPLDIMIKDLDGNALPVDPAQANMLQRMAKATWLDKIEGDLAVETVYAGTLLIPSEELLDKEAEIAKLKQEEKRLNGELARSRGILNNPGFLNKAPQAKIDEEKRKQSDYEKQLSAVIERLKMLDK
ncbi:MAG: class I tRNA ligase family protein, partial [Solobacterium sp.]|nr:class I tRNA ligase family protein [Solobacterium sp.]